MSQHQRPPSRGRSEHQGAGSRPQSRAGSVQHDPPAHHGSRAGSIQLAPASRPSSRSGRGEPRTHLLCVAYAGAIPHWGFLHLDPNPDDPNVDADSGLLIHVGIRTGTSGSSAKYANELKFKDVHSMSNSAIKHSYPVVGALLTRQEAVSALTAIYNKKIGNYQILANNCQHFCIIGMKELKDTVCPEISSDTIRAIERKTSPTTRVFYWFKVQLGRLQRE